MWEEIGGLDERVSFWCSDDCVIEQVKLQGIEPMLVVNSIVNHLGSTTFKTTPRNKWADLTWKDVDVFNKIYDKNKFEDNVDYKRWKIKNKID